MEITKRNYKGLTIEHLHGTLTFKVFDDKELIVCKSTLKEAKRAADHYIKFKGVTV